MSDTPIMARPQNGKEADHAIVDESATGKESEAEAPAARGVHRLVYLSMLFSIVLGLMFASDSLVSYSYDLPQNKWADYVSLLAEEWHREMQNTGLAGVPERIRDWVATVRGGQGD